ncbi:MAG TPA: hypothetical protein VIN04_00015 [Myxococcota bacterium]
MSRSRSTDQGAKRPASGLRALVRTVALALVLAFAVGFGIGTWLRCAAERQAPILAGAEVPAPGR